jgi:hypothetical protein
MCTSIYEGHSTKSLWDAVAFHKLFVSGQESEIISIPDISEVVVSGYVPIF